MQKFIESKPNYDRNVDSDFKKVISTKHFAHFEEYKLVTGIVMIRQNTFYRNLNVGNFIKNTFPSKFYDIESV